MIWYHDDDDVEFVYLSCYVFLLQYKRLLSSNTADTAHQHFFYDSKSVDHNDSSSGMNDWSGPHTYTRTSSLHQVRPSNDESRVTITLCHSGEMRREAGGGEGGGSARHIYKDKDRKRSRDKDRNKDMGGDCDSDAHESLGEDIRNTNELLNDSGLMRFVSIRI